MLQRADGHWNTSLTWHREGISNMIWYMAWYEVNIFLIWNSTITPYWSKKTNSFLQYLGFSLFSCHITCSNLQICPYTLTKECLKWLPFYVWHTLRLATFRFALTPLQRKVWKYCLFIYGTLWGYQSPDLPLQHCKDTSKWLNYVFFYIWHTLRLPISRFALTTLQRYLNMAYICFLYVAHFEVTNLQICPYNLTKTPQHDYTTTWEPYDLSQPPDLPLQPYRGKSEKFNGSEKNNVQFFSGYCNGVWSRFAGGDQIIWDPCNVHIRKKQFLLAKVVAMF